MLEEIRIRMYGNYRCSCGCGKVLGNPSPYYGLKDICYGVGRDDDEDGDEWRMFRPECWSKLNDMSLEEIYNKYPASPVVNEAVCYE